MLKTHEVMHLLLWWQSFKEFHGRPFMPQLGGTVRPLDPTNEAVPSSTTMGMKHPHHGAQESNVTKRLRQGELLESQQEMPAPVVPHSQSPLPLTVAPSGTPGTSGAAAPGMKTPLWSGKNQVPLAERMRPMSVDDIVGQDHLLGPRCILRSLLDNNSLSSIILWGPPGTGKTSLVRSIARTVSFRFVSLSAVSSGVKEVREVLEESKRLQKFGQRTLLFLDEIHR
jgi:putative ATPase